MDDIRSQLKTLSSQLKVGMSDTNRGTKEQRRQVISKIGTFQSLTRFKDADELRALTGGRTVCATDGSINSWPPSAQWPHQIFILRSLTAANKGKSYDVERNQVYSPLVEYLANESASPDQARFKAKKDTEKILARLEAEAAIDAILKHDPVMMWMDGPLVRLEMNARRTFEKLRELALTRNILLVGCIENIDSSSINFLLQDAAPPGMRNKKDRDILWNTLNVGECLELHAAAKGLPRDDDEQGTPIRTYFLRNTSAKGAIGMDLLEEQVDLAKAIRVTDIAFSLTELDGRGIPSVMDLADQRVKLTHNEMHLYLSDLDADILEILEPKRSQRPR